MTRRSLRAIRSFDAELPLTVVDSDAHHPRVAADFTVLNETVVNVLLDEDFNPLAAVGTGDPKHIVHLERLYVLQSRGAVPQFNIAKIPAVVVGHGKLCERARRSLKGRVRTISDDSSTRGAASVKSA